MVKLLKYDLLYLYKTQKFVVFVGIFLLFSIVSPLTARYLNELLGFLLAGQEINLGLPDPTVYTAYETYLSDLNETIFFVILFVSISIFIRDKTKGLLPLIFSKPIHRGKYILSKYLSLLILLVVCTLIGYAVFTYYTYVLFDQIFFWRGLAMMGLYLLFVLCVSSAALWFSTLSKSYLIAMLYTFGVYLAFMILSALGSVAVFEYLPGMLLSTSIGVLHQTVETVDLLWTIAVTLLITGGFLWGAWQRVRSIDIG
jgi:ABC-2 type transport system permease protein